jgi:radical SAM superfamily enzyme YgiQ (UPF0313 family)
LPEDSAVTDIILTTLNSSYKHTAFGLRYLHANLGEYRSRARIQEFTIHKPATEIVAALVAEKPKIIGFGVYIWNTEQTLPVIELLKAKYPEILVVLGGPEVSHETTSQKICQLADHVICGEADFLFREFCHQVLGENKRPEQKIISGPLPDISQIHSPYSLYDTNDIQNRIIYVEASRGCPYKCEYCLSSLDKSVRNFPLESFLTDLEKLIEKGTRQFKFIDRTFNLSPSISTKILQFFLDRIQLGLFLHFEMVPDRLPEELKVLIRQFPAGCLQFEIGVQTWNPTVAALVSRRQDYQKVRENLNYLREQTGVHTHVDLIAGLPGETLESFAAGFDQLAALKPDEIQVGILKRLKGTPIIRHDREWEMLYDTKAPFQILRNKTMLADTVAKFQKFSKYWDLIANSGNFQETALQIRQHCEQNAESLFSFYWNLTGFLNQRHETAHSIHLLKLFESLLVYFESQNRDLKASLAKDYQRGRPGPLPKFLRTVDEKADPIRSAPHSLGTHIPKRQRLHLKEEGGEGKVAT